MEMVEGRPAPALRPLIGHYHGYRELDGTPGHHRGLPSPYLTLIVTLDEPLVVEAHPDPAQSPGRYETLVGGLHTTPALIANGVRQAGVQVALSPLGARALFGLPAGALRNLDVDAALVLGHAAHELHERLNAAPSWERRFAILDELLLRRADLGRDVPAEVARAFRLLMSTGGAMTVAELAREVGWSARHLSARFATETGLGPKAAARVIRFDRARRELQRMGAARGSSGSAPGPAGAGLAGLAEVAVEHGYYDQAHLAREFRELAGCPPSRWLAEEFRFVQASGTAPAPDSTA
ncbi:helix-turn-helix domain-containing protein [Sphaerisporangium sp. NPDC004334]